MWPRAMRYRLTYVRNAPPTTGCFAQPDKDRERMGVLFSWRQRGTPISSSAQPRTEEDVRQLLRLLPRYRVLLYNDDLHDMDYVVHALVRTVPTLSEEEAVQVMLRAHLTGVGQVLICPKDLAEHYRERLESYGLTSTIEPA